MIKRNDNIEEIERQLKAFMIEFSEYDCSEEDHEQFLELLNKLPLEDRKKYMEQFFFQPKKSSIRSDDRKKLNDLIETAINRNSAETIPLRRQRFAILKLCIAAAVVISLSGMAIFVFKNRDNSFEKSVANTNLQPKAISRQTSDQILLTLSDGSVIQLDSAKVGLLTSETGSNITKSSDGLIINTTSKSESSEQTYNILQTPRGRQYQIILPDKSVVWLNAASSIKFPNQFSDERKVEIEGEAYFEISKDKSKPFRVVSRNQTTEVLGTIFNINAYPDQKEVRTTLVEGSIKVSTLSSDDQKILRPGQQSAVNDQIKVYKIDAQDAISWKTGYLVFEHQNIRNIMQHIERWYDFEITYQGNITNENFLGSVKRHEDVRDVLKTLELTGLVHFKVEGKNITVLP